MDRLILHEDPLSGNCYKIRLTAAHVGAPIERRSYDIRAGETRTRTFLRDINPNGRIPVLQIGERFLPESNAACFYLADGSGLIPDDRFGRADMLRWMFFEQYNHEPTIATLRFWRAHLGLDALSDAQRAQIATKQSAGESALALMDDHLRANEWLAAGRFSVADICLYAYTHVAAEGGFELGRYPHVGAWLDRVAAQPGHVAMA